jgi:hypothetical protein
MSFRSFSIDRAAANISCRCSLFESKSTWTRCRSRSFISAFNERHDKRLFSFFVVDEIFTVRNRVVSDSLMRRTRRLSKIADSWTIATLLMCAWTRLRSFCVCEIDRNSCSVCALFCHTLCESSTTCFRFAYDIAHAFVADLDVNRWKKRVFRSQESIRTWRERFRRYFESICFEWQQACLWFSFFLSWVCVKSSFRKWELSESRMCTALEFCERWHLMWTSTFLWKSWTVLSSSSEFFVRANFISDECRSEFSKLVCRFSTVSCSIRSWSWLSCQTFYKLFIRK